MHVLYFKPENNINCRLPGSMLNSFDWGETATLFDNKQESNHTLWSDHIRSYEKYNELSEKYKITDQLNGQYIYNIENFLRELLDKDLKITAIKETINLQGYPVYSFLVNITG